MFKNYMTGEMTDDAVFTMDGHRWFIKMGFAGFNSNANNRDGYSSEANAKKAITRYQSRSA